MCVTYTLSYPSDSASLTRSIAVASSRPTDMKHPSPTACQHNSA